MRQASPKSAWQAVRLAFAGWTAAAAGARGEQWTRRHTVVLIAIALYLPMILASARATMLPVDLTTTYLLVVVLLGVLAFSPKIDPIVRQTLAAGALLTANVTFIEATGRSTLAHLGFAFVLVLITLYQSWLLQLAATVYVAFYYLVLGWFIPELVFSPTTDMSSAPAMSAAYCAAAILASVPAIAAWSLNSTDARATEALQVALAEAALRERQAAELNDTVMQDLVTALYASEAGDLDMAADANRRAVESARRIVDALLEGGGGAAPGDLVRNEPAQGTDDTPEGDTP